jgi:hypothetical protein
LKGLAYLPSLGLAKARFEFSDPAHRRAGFFLARDPVGRPPLPGSGWRGWCSRFSTGQRRLGAATRSLHSRSRNTRRRQGPQNATDNSFGRWHRRRPVTLPGNPRRDGSQLIFSPDRLWRYRIVVGAVFPSPGPCLPCWRRAFGWYFAGRRLRPVGRSHGGLFAFTTHLERFRDAGTGGSVPLESVFGLGPCGAQRIRSGSIDVAHCSPEVRNPDATILKPSGN